VWCAAYFRIPIYVDVQVLKDTVTSRVAFLGLISTCELLAWV